MLVTVVAVIAACSRTSAPTWPSPTRPGAFHLDGTFFAGLGAGLLIAVYDYLGYNTVAYMGDELKQPGRTMPRSIVYSIVGIMVIYLVLNVGVVGAVPWQEVEQSTSVASLVGDHEPGATRPPTSSPRSSSSRRSRRCSPACSAARACRSTPPATGSSSGSSAECTPSTTSRTSRCS